MARERPCEVVKLGNLTSKLFNSPHMTQKWLFELFDTLKDQSYLVKAQIQIQDPKEVLVQI